MKKLIDFIQKLDADKKIKIGANNGSGFFYCGTAGDFVENAAAYDVIVNRETMRKYNRALHEYKRYMSGDPGSLAAYLKYADRVGEDFSLDGYTDFLQAYFKACEVRKMLLARRTAEKDSYKDLTARHLADTFEADELADPGVTVILTEGYEEGKYWMHHEAKEPVAFGSLKENKEGET